MKLKLFLLTMILSNFLIGCASFSKKVTLDNQVNLNSKTVANLTGTYEINSSKAIRKFENSKPEIIINDTINRFGLFETIKETNQELRNDIKNNISNYEVKIKVQNEKIISFSLLKNKNIIDSIKVNYKVKKDGFIYLTNKNFKTKYVPILCGNFELNRTRIGLNKENNLILNNSYFIYGAILVIIGDTRKSNFGSEYKRKI